MRRLNDNLKADVLRMHREGKGAVRIANLLNAGRDVVERIIRDSGAFPVPKTAKGGGHMVDPHRADARLRKF